MFQTIIHAVGILSLGSIGFLYMWFGMRDWRRFLLKQPARPMPRSMSRLTLYLLLGVIPWGIQTIVQDAKSFFYYLNHPQTKAEWVVLGFLAFCYLISLAARYLPSDPKTTASE